MLLDHISKSMNDLNLERCRCIPVNTPGADWRVLKQIVEDDKSRAFYKVRCSPRLHFLPRRTRCASRFRAQHRDAAC